MMDCGHVRRAMLAEPSSDDAEVRLHLATCPECTRYAVQLRRFEDRLDRALRVDVNPRLMEQRVVTPLRAPRSRGAHLPELARRDLALPARADAAREGGESGVRGRRRCGAWPKRRVAFRSPP